MTRYHIPICILLSCILEASGNHLRGALITWASTGIGTEISISYRLVYNFRFECSVALIQNQTARTGLGIIECFSNCLMFQPLTFICTDLNVQDNWSSGRFTFKYDPGTSGVIKFGYKGGFWDNSVLGGGGGRKLVVTADLSERSDTGKINSSPTVDVSPFVKLQFGCFHEIKLLVNDVDGDIVKCRFATSAQDECSSICNSFPGFMIDEDKCILSYNANDGIGLYAVAIQVEDFKPDDLMTPLSSIPVQFLVDVFTTTRECDPGPVFVPPSPNNEETIDLDVGSSLYLNITAASAVRSVTGIITISPVSLLKTAPRFSNNGTASFLSIGVSWTPKSSDVGQYTLCFTASDSYGFFSMRYVLSKCITNCTGLPNGDYQSCKSCNMYATCSNGMIYDYRPCAAGNLLWDDTLKTCEYNSSTCTEDSKCLEFCDAKQTGGPYQDCDTCHGFVKCLNGVKLSTPCPAGLKYDTISRVCDFPSNAVCTVKNTA